MSPLSPIVYLVRNAGKTLPLVGVIVLAVTLISGIVAIMNSIPLSIRTTYGYSKNYLGVTPRGNPAMTPVLRARIEKDCPVPIGQVMVCRASDLEVRSIVGPWRFVIVALGQEDIRDYVNRLGGGRLNGRFPKAGEAGVVLSEPVARNLGKSLGDVLLSPETPEAYSPREVKIVGIVDSSVWLAVASIEYHAANHFPPIDLLIVTAADVSRQAELDEWCFEALKGEQARVFTYAQLEKETSSMFQILYMILNVVIALLVVVITIMMGMLMNIYQSQRTQEFALLQALGLTRGAILRRSLAETLWVVMFGWSLGVVVAWALLSGVRDVLFYPRAFMLDPLDPSAYAYTIPVPVAIMLTGAAGVIVRFRRFDPVGVLERRIA